MKRCYAASFGAVVLGLLANACEDDCGPGYERHEHLCRVAQEQGEAGEGNGGAVAGGAGAGAAGAGGTGECEVSTFEQTCLTVQDCECDADFCAGLPGQEGFCTRTGCDEDPSVCPGAWTCTDLSPFGPDLPAICTPP